MDLEVVGSQRAVRSSDPAVALAGHALSVLAAAVPADGAVWYALDHRGRVDGAVVYEPEPWGWRPEEAVRAYATHYRALDPFAADGSRHLKPVTTSNDLGYGDFTQHAFARRFLTRVGFAHLAVVTVLRHGRPSGQAWVGRRYDAGSFTAAEQLVMRRLHGLLDEAFRLIPVTQQATEVAPMLQERLTDRELEVARLAATGATNPEIADTLSITRATVATHLHRILKKLGLRSRTELARLLARVTPRSRGRRSAADTDGQE